MNSTLMAEVLFGSAELMPRNRDERIQVLAPIESDLKAC